MISYVVYLLLTVLEIKNKECVVNTTVKLCMIFDKKIHKSLFIFTCILFLLIYALVGKIIYILFALRIK